MKVFNRWKRSAAALAAIAAVVGLATIPATAAAEPVRTATTTKHTRAVYLQHALGLPASNTNPVIESVTYDRFQHLLRQPGNFAILIGDPATDDKFAARARDVETTASAAGVKKVYWFNPNLSGNATVGTITVPNLDIRNPAGITSLPVAEARDKYRDAWLNLVAQSLGNGLTATRNSPGAQGQSVTITPSAAAVNDNADGLLYDYSGGLMSTPADVTDSYFLVYNAENTQSGQPDKIVSWINLTKEADSTSTQPKVTTAINAVGAANFGRVDQFKWWQDEANERQRVYAGANPANGADVPVITDADNAAADGGWRVNQISYPELIDLLKNSTDADAVILFGGTWCPNTRAVIKQVNEYAQENDVTVYNYDTVLDGGIVGGNPTGGTNPLQTRNPHRNGAHPSYLYGELVTQYLGNFQTEYTTNNTITYFPNGDTTQPAVSAKRLQVPYLISHKGTGGDAPHGGVTRQWIIKLNETSYREYMSLWWYTNPQPNKIGLTALPQGAPAWQKINAHLANFSWRTNPATLYANTAVDTDDTEYILDTDKANVTYNPAGSGSVTVSSSATGAVDINPAALSAALSALGASAPVNNAAARTAYIAARRATPEDPELIAKLTTVVGAWGVAQARKNSVNNAWGSATSPGSVAGGAAAVRALEVFFGGLPGGVVSTRTVTANPVTYGTAPTINLTIANEHGRQPAGNVALVVKQGATTVASASTAVANDAASFTLPILAAGTYDYSLSYAGDDQLLAFTETGSLTVSPAEVTPEPTPIATPVPNPGPPPTNNTVTRIKAGKLAGAVSKAATSKKAGKYKVTITTPSGLSKATGKVTIKLKKGKTTKTITGTLKNGTVTVSVPKLARGTWKVAISWTGDSRYLAASATGASIKVKK